MAIARDLGFLRLIFNFRKSPVEELLFAAGNSILNAVRNVNPQELKSEAVRLGKALCDLYRDDYDTLRRLMGRLETWLV